MIQIDMPMPKNCADCCFATADLVNGKITLFCMTQAGKRMYAPDLISRKDRPEWCPIKEQQNVVRCRDCKYWRRLLLNRDGCGVCHTDNPIRVSNESWYCADGERRINTNDQD